MFREWIKQQFKTLKKAGAMISCLILFVLVNTLAAAAEDELSGKLVVFHAGSLSMPLKQIADGFKTGHPGVHIFLEAAGSRDCARKVSDLKRPCDVLASADYLVIDQLLIPEYADWNIRFAANEMTIVYHDASRRAGEIDSNNWFEILMDPKVIFGRANPNADPCGYRAVLTMQLAEWHYKKPDLSKKMLKKDNNFIRPKETDLLALLEANALDYIFLYRSVAEQHRLKYVLLPDQINLKNAELANLYRRATIDLPGKKPGEVITQKGEPMVYGLTIPKNSPNPKAARAFVKYVLSQDRGMAIIEKLGQPSVVPSICENWAKLPEDLKPFALKKE
jgi:molybdate/tungstate transport system substrate-binding protein